MNKLYYALCALFIDEMQALETRQEKFMSEMTPEARSTYFEDDESDSRPYQVVNGIAMYSINGKMMSTGNFFTQWLGIPTYDVMADDFARMAGDDEVSRILISMGTPGGHVAGISDLSDAWSRLNASKPITVHTAGMLASAGVWLASNSTNIYASAVADVGSIGVVMQHVSQEEALKKQGIKVTEIKSAPLKHIGSPAFDLTAEELDHLQKKVNESDELFKKQIYSTRPQILPEAFSGETFSASNSLRIGLIDGIKTYSEVYEQLSASADSDEDDAKNGGFQMKKRYVTQAMADAAISAGANPESLVICSQEEFDTKQEANELVFDDGAEPTAEELAEQEEADRLAAEAAALEGEGEGEAEAEAAPTLEDQLAETVTLLGTAEERVRSLEAELAEALEAVEAVGVSAESIDGLMAIALERTTTMRVALSLASVDMAEFKAEALLAEHASVDSQFKKAFKTGGIVKAKVVEPKTAKAVVSKADAGRMSAVGV